jgi:ABC-type sugar transport system substrate-binding protein
VPGGPISDGIPVFAVIGDVVLAAAAAVAVGPDDTLGEATAALAVGRTVGLGAPACTDVVSVTTGLEVLLLVSVAGATLPC